MITVSTDFKWLKIVDFAGFLIYGIIQIIECGLLALSSDFQ